MPKYLDIDGLRTLWAQITNKISHESNATAEALEGKADLVEGKIPASQLPSYVDDVLEYANKASFPATGESGKIYLDLATNLTYRWGGTAYTEISPSLALGTTSSTAYRGDYGAAAYTHAVTNKGIAKTSGLYKITTNAEGHVTAATAVVKADITGLGIPAQDTTYENATTTTNGLMSATDKTKLNNIDLSVLVKSVNGITPDSNGNVAIEVGGGTVSGDYLPLTGGTLSGSLRTTKTSQAFVMGTSAKPTLVTLSMGTGDLGTRTYFTHYDENSSYYENFVLPGTKDLTKEGNYWILTTKSAVTVAQGGTGTNDAFKVGNNIYVKSLAGGTVIPANSDLNTYVTIGNYYCSSNANAATITNSPVTEAFNLQVYSMVGNHTTAPTANAYRYFTQELTTLYGIKYIRAVYYNNSTTATFGGWRQILNSDYVPTAIGASGCGVTVGLFENHPLVSATLNGKQEWSLQRVAGTYDIKIHFNNTNGDWQNSAIFLNSLNCLEQGVRKIYYHYSQLGLTAAATSYEIWAALPADSSFVAHNSNFSQVTDTPNGYGIVQITKTNNNYGAGSFTRVNVATSDFYQASFYLDRTFDGWRKIITSEGGVFSGNLQINNGTDESTIHFTPSNSNAYGGILYYYKPTSSDKDRSRWGFRQYSFSASDPNTRTEHAYTYYLPKTPSGLTASSTYEILTTKNAVTVAQGGTGKTTLTSGYALIGNGTSAVSLRAITNNTAKGPLEWTSSTGTNLVTTNTLAYWNGSYTGTSSNISVLGTITTGIWNGSAIPVAHGGTGATTAAAARTNLGITDNKVAQTSTNPTTSTKYYPLAGSSSSTTTAGAVFNSAFNVNFKNGTASAEGDIELVLGNSTATGTAGNKTGWLCLYSPGTSYHMIKPASTNSALTHTLPAKSGTILNTGTFVASTTAPSSPITGMFWVDIS